MTVSQNDIIDAPDLSHPGPSGRVTWDDRGRSVWEWQVQPGVFTRDIDAQALARLAPELKLVEGPAKGNLSGAWHHEIDQEYFAARLRSEPTLTEMQAKARGARARAAKRSKSFGLMWRLGFAR